MLPPGNGTLDQHTRDSNLQVEGEGERWREGLSKAFYSVTANPRPVDNE